MYGIEVDYRPAAIAEKTNVFISEFCWNFSPLAIFQRPFCSMIVDPALEKTGGMRLHLGGLGIACVVPPTYREDQSLSAISSYDRYDGIKLISINRCIENKTMNTLTCCDILHHFWYR